MEQVFPKKGISVLKQKERNSDDKNSNDKMAEKKTYNRIDREDIQRPVCSTKKKNMSNLFSGIFSLTKQQIEESSKISNRLEKKHRIHREPTGRKSGQCSK